MGDGTAGEFEEDAANAPLETDELRGLVDFSFGEDVDPLALLQQADRFVDCGLEDAVATNDGNDLATLEEGANGFVWIAQLLSTKGVSDCSAWVPVALPRQCAPKQWIICTDVQHTQKDLQRSWLSVLVFN